MHTSMIQSAQIRTTTLLQHHPCLGVPTRPLPTFPPIHVSGPQPASVDHWTRFIAKRVEVCQRLGLSFERDQELMAVVMLFAESMHKVRGAR